MKNEYRLAVWVAAELPIETMPVADIEHADFVRIELSVRNHQDELCRHRPDSAPTSWLPFPRTANGDKVDDVFAKIAVERIQLADLLDGLNEQQWAKASLCAGWRVREVVAHLVMPLEISLPKLLLAMARNRFDFNRVADNWAKHEARPNAELAAILRANAGHHFTPPGFGPEAPLTDTVVHHIDIAQPLGLSTAVNPDHARIVLDLLVSKKAARGFVKKGFLDGLQLTATDLDWTHGQGATVAGRSDALISAIAGRSALAGQLTGDGASQLQSRL